MPDNSSRSETGNGPDSWQTVADHITRFSRDLREVGAAVPANAGIDATRAAQIVGIQNRSRLKAALRGMLVSREEDLAIFDRLFPRFWKRLADDVDIVGSQEEIEFIEEVPTVVANDDDEAGDPPGNGGETDSQQYVREKAPDDDMASRDLEKEGQPGSPGGSPADDDNDDHGIPVSAATYSRVGNAKRIELDPREQTDDLSDAVYALSGVIENLKGRRWGPNSSGDQLDVRRALRHSFGSGGTVPDIPFRARKRTAVRALVLVDVSQSVLDTIDREFLLRFLRYMHDEWRNVRIFFFDTSVREVSDRFAGPSDADVLAALREAEAEWGGGTRIGHSVATIRREHPYAVDRETNVFIISDGLEVEEVGQLKEEMALLSRRAHTVFWLNPLAASPEYEPTCRGMAAVLPYLDALFAFADESDIFEIARQLQFNEFGDSIGFQYDQRERTEL